MDIYEHAAVKKLQSQKRGPTFICENTPSRAIFSYCGKIICRCKIWYAKKYIYSGYQPSPFPFMTPPRFVLLGKNTTFILMATTRELGYFHLIQVTPHIHLF